MDRVFGTDRVDTRIAEAFDVTIASVENVRKRCLLEGLIERLELVYTPKHGNWKPSKSLKI